MLAEVASIAVGYLPPWLDKVALDFFCKKSGLPEGRRLKIAPIVIPAEPHAHDDVPAEPHAPEAAPAEPHAHDDVPAPEPDVPAEPDVPVVAVGAEYARKRNLTSKAFDYFTHVYKEDLRLKAVRLQRYPAHSKKAVSSLIKVENI